MPNNCENCTHWRRQAARPEAVTNTIGECRANPPAQSYNWPRTHATDFCSCHSAAAHYAAALPPKPEKPKARKGEELPLR